MRTCIYCQSTHFEINPDDLALCCTSCGTVVEEAALVAGLEEGGSFHATTNPRKRNESKETLIWIKKFAAYLGTDATFSEAEYWYKEHLKECPRKYSKELALYIVYLIQKRTNSGLNIEDMVARCPEVIDMTNLRQVHSTLSPNIPFTRVDWTIKMDTVFPALYPVVSENINHQFNKANAKLKQKRIRPNSKPEEREVRKVTVQLLDIYRKSENAAGKHQRPLIAAAIALAYMYCFQKNIISKAPGAPILTIQQMLEVKVIAKDLGCGYRTVLQHLNDLQNFILVCTRDIPWLKNKKEIKLKTAYFYLDDVLDLVKPRGVSHHHGIIPLSEETVPSYLRSQQRSQLHEEALRKAMHKDYGAQIKKGSVEYIMRALLEKGVGVEELRSRTYNQLRQLYSVHYYREMVNSVTVSQVPNLNQIRITEEEMSEAELGGYLHTFVR